MNDHAVLVVGGRTTGLMMAAELARHGVAVRIIDRSPGIDPHVRANLLHSRTLEIFEMLGIADATIEGSYPERGIRIYVNGSLAGVSQHAPIDSRFPFGMSQSQAHTEAVLEAHLSDFGVSVERSVTLSRLQQDDDAVVATLVHDDGTEETCETPWLIGCDGAHSTVRHSMGWAFPGDADPYAYLVADVVVEGDLVEEEGYVCLHDEGDLFIFSTLPEGRRLIAANLPKGSIARAPTLYEMQRLVDERAFRGLRLSDPRWLSSFHIHYRLAPHYRGGRIFLAGDAAHVHSLLGGQGMNTGIQDAHNLAWKLALVVKGTVPESWLDSYEIERRQVGEAVLATTKQVTEETELFANLPSAGRERLVAHMFVPEAKRLEAAEHLQEVDLDYRQSGLCFEPEPFFASGPSVGTRAPDASPVWVHGQPGRFTELLRGTRHQLLFFAGLESDRARGAIPEDMIVVAREVLETEGHWIDGRIVVLDPSPVDRLRGIPTVGDPEGAMHARYGAHRACLYLIRPDGYVAFRSAKLDGLCDYLAQTR